MYLNADIDTRKDQAAYTVALDTRGRTPSAVYVYDVKSLRLGAARVAVRGGKAVLATRSPWFMAVFCYGKAPLAADIDVVLRSRRERVSRFARRRSDGRGDSSRQPGRSGISPDPCSA